MDVRYWDSDCFLGWLLEEADKMSECGEVLTEASAGRVQIVTSALTLAEVIKLGKGRTPVPSRHADRIREVFSRSCIVVRNLDRFIAEDARQLIWDNSGVSPKDAIHVATALRLHLRVFNTFDGDLIGLTERFGDPPMRIERPAVAQRKLGLGGP